MVINADSLTDQSLERSQNEESASLPTSQAKKVLLKDELGNTILPAGPAAAVSDGNKSVPTATSRVQLSASSVPCRRVFIQAFDDNAGTMVVGGSTVVAAVATRRGAGLFPSQGSWFNVDNLNLLWLDTTNSGDEVNFFVET